jgi:hypothetical protein
MTEMDSYVAPFEVGQVMEGGGLASSSKAVIRASRRARW